MTKQEAVSAVITYETLPPQIDYTKPYWTKAVKAAEFIDALPQAERDECYAEIRLQVELYNTPGECGHSQAELDAMF